MNMTELEDQFIRIEQGLLRARYLCEVLDEFALPRDQDSRERYFTFTALLEEIITRACADASAFGDAMFNSVPEAH